MCSSIPIVLLLCLLMLYPCVSSPLIVSMSWFLTLAGLASGKSYSEEELVSMRDLAWDRIYVCKYARVCVFNHNWYFLILLDFTINSLKFEFRRCKADVFVPLSLCV